MTIKLITAFIISVLFTTLFGSMYLPWLRKHKAAQPIKDDAPERHHVKAGTPTMGGVMFIIGTAIAVFSLGLNSMLKGNYVHVSVFFFALIFGAIGFLDDWEKLKRRQNLGLRARTKAALQILVALIFIYLMFKLGYVSQDLYIPFFNTTLFVPRWLYIIISAFIIVGTVNSVNLTDGIDGLATGTTIPVMLFFVILTFFTGTRYFELGLFASALLGGLVGFLVYNFNPAKVFMGDTGSLFLGGAVAAMAFAFDIPLVLITLGIIYIIEALSDIIQVGYFKATHGKRVFRMAPFHHHLEMGGWTGHKWKEKELFVLFTCVSLIFAILSFISVYRKFM